MNLFFDLDGPILDVSERYYRLYQDLMREYGGEALAKGEYWELKRRRVCESEIMIRSGLTARETDFTTLRRDRIEEPRYLCHDRVWPQALEALRMLQGEAAPVLVTLRHDPEALRWQLEGLGLRPLFSRVLSTPAVAGLGEQGRTKADLVREALGAQRFEGWFVGDTATDILAGRELGLKTAAVTFGIRTAAEFAPLAPDRLLADPAELEGWARGLGEEMRRNR